MDHRTYYRHATRAMHINLNARSWCCSREIPVYLQQVLAAFASQHEPRRGLIAGAAYRWRVLVVRE